MNKQITPPPQWLMGDLKQDRGGSFRTQSVYHIINWAHFACADLEPSNLTGASALWRATKVEAHKRVKQLNSFA